MSYLITGSAGFIGFHLAVRLLKEGVSVVGFDNLNSYYDPSLKIARLEFLKRISETKKTPFYFFKGDLSDKNKVQEIFSSFKPSKVVNLAAQAGVRYSIEKPEEYIQSNMVGFLNILEACRNFDIEHLVYASSSSVYGGNKKLPFSENDNINHPVSIYAASKTSNELMAHSYSHLFQIPTTGLRFFTVYGPWGRPDMAFFKFTKQIINNEPIRVFNNGNMFRDFTYIDDVVESIIKVIKKVPNKNNNFDFKNPSPGVSWAPYKVFNIGNSTPTPLMDYIKALEISIGKEAEKIFLPMQPGDVQSTQADTVLLEKWIDFKPSTTIQDGIDKFVKWYLEFYNIE